MSWSRIGSAVAATLTCLALASSAEAEPARTKIVNGQQISITAAPWQVYVYSASEACGGSVLDARRVLTAAHCVDGGTAPGDVTVLAGASDVAGWAPGRPTPTGAQAVKAAGIRIHPYYDPAPHVADDVAVVTLAGALNVSTPRTKPIALPAVGGGLVPGTAVQATGYGMQVQGQAPDGKLYSGSFAAMSDLSCLTWILPDMTPSVLCANGPAGAATCFGDSGGPLVVGGVLVGVMSLTSGPSCAAPVPGGFADVTAPEVRAFIDGSNTPPRAPRLAGDARITTVNPPVVGSPLTCLPGDWSDGATVGYTFLDPASGRSLQSGPGATFSPTTAHVGAAVGCAIQAANGGGVSSARTAATPAIVADNVPPQAVLRSVRCRKRRCTVRFQAVDPNSLGALRIRVTAERRVRAWCRDGKGRKRHRVRCTKRRVKRLAVRHAGRVDWVATAKRVPRGRATVRVRINDAGGNPARRRGLKRRIRVR